MFGSRGILRAPEGDGSGGAAPTPPPGGDPTPAPAPAPAPAPTEVVFTPEQQAVINKLVGQARVEGRNAATKAQPAPQPSAPPPAPAEQKLTLEDIARELAETKARARFDKQALRRGLSDDAADDLFELYKVQKPTDDENWFTEREKRLGLKQPATQPQPSTTTTAPAQPQPSGPPLSDKGSPAPGGVVNWEREYAENPGFMSAAARAAMDAKYGHEKARRMRIEAVNAPGGQAERLRVVTKQG